MSSFIIYWWMLVLRCVVQNHWKLKIEVSVRDEMRAEVSRILLIFKCRAEEKKTDDDDDDYCAPMDGFTHAVASLYVILVIILWSVGFKCQIYGVTLQNRLFLFLLNDSIVLLSLCFPWLFFLLAGLWHYRNDVLFFYLFKSTHTQYSIVFLCFARLLLCLFSVYI